ncbi:MAG: nucleotidyltransferase family protein, partial [Candidatus Krumholzibacteriia bacterium]
GALLLTVYDDPAERPFGDLDLLVRPAELDAAAAIMRRLGYRLDEAYQPESFYRAHHYHLIFRHSGHPWLCFEIHWDLSLPAMDVAFDAEGLRRRAVPVRRDELEILVPSPGDALLLLALHAGLNRFATLGQIRDVAALADTAPAELAAGDLWQAARTGRLAVPLATSLRLARLFGGAGADRLLAARPRPWRGALLRRILRPEIVLRQSLLRSTAGGEAASWLRRDDWAGRLAHLRRMVWPGAGDLGMDGHRARGPGGLTLWPSGRYGPGAPLRSALWTALILTGWDLHPEDVNAAHPAQQRCRRNCE